ncbi:MAG: HAMP domain-containing sensor histidine kinase, partial [Planctomycetota bacterium]|nr:HAMP domain-containing sensor histidine kinase [Planctomycetota bacterium]
AGTSSVRPLTLASLPIKLEPGAVIHELSNGLTPLRFSIFVAWVGLVLAAVAVAAMLWTAFQLSERRGAFVSAVTHELRTPLTTFQLYTEMLADGRLTDENKRKQYLDTLRAEANRLSHLVENVLSFARLERTHAAGHVEDIRVADLFSRVEQSLRLRADQAEMQLEIVTPEPDLTIQADRGAVERIVFNLVDNACKYGNSLDQPKVQVTCRSKGKSAEIRVRDFGDGVSARDRKRLFRPFSKSANEAAHSAPGVGLGLALCRRLARSMRGNLELDRSMTDGACFVLILPTGVR